MLQRESQNDSIRIKLLFDDGRFKPLVLPNVHDFRDASAGPFADVNQIEHLHEPPIPRIVYAPS